MLATMLSLPSAFTTCGCCAWWGVPLRVDLELPEKLAANRFFGNIPQTGAHQTLGRLVAQLPAVAGAVPRVAG